MTLRCIFLFLFVLALTFTAAPAAHAQTTIQYFTNTAKPEQALPMQCAIAGDELVKDIALFPHPDKWTYIVICDDASWNKVMTAEWNCGSKFIHGATNRTNGSTFLRGTTLRGESKEVTPEHLVVHEPERR